MNKTIENAIKGKYYVYILYDPIFISSELYVGYSGDVQDRYDKHCRNTARVNKRKIQTINEIKSRSGIPGIKLVAEYTLKQDALKVEKELAEFVKSLKIKLMNKATCGYEMPVSYGEDNCNGKFGDQQVFEMRRMFYEDRINATEIAKKFNISIQHICKILKYTARTNNVEIPHNIKELYRQTIRETKPQNKTFGENNGMAKLNAIIVAKARDDFFNKKIDRQTILETIDITTVTLDKILHYKIWRNNVDIPHNLDELLSKRNNEDWTKYRPEGFNSKLINEDVEHIREDYFVHKKTMTELANKFNISINHISRIVKYECWNKNVIVPENIEELVENRIKEDVIKINKYNRTNKASKLNPQKAAEIRRLYFDEHITRKELADKFDIDKSVIDDVVNYRSWTDDIEIPSDLREKLDKRIIEDKKQFQSTNKHILITSR
jgi:predicted GIY-YIG superfamily endonuclease